MLNIGFGEILLLMALLLVVVGPERLPTVLRWVGQHYGKLRRAASELQNAFMDEADLLDARRYGSQAPRQPAKQPARPGPQHAPKPTIEAPADESAPPAPEAQPEEAPPVETSGTPLRPVAVLDDPNDDPQLDEA